MKRHSASLDMRRRNADHKPQGDFTRARSATAKGQITGSAGQDRRTGDPAPCWWERRTVRPLHLSKLNRAAPCPDTSATRGRIKGTSQVHVKTRTRPFSGVLFSTVKSGNDRDAYQWMMGKQTLRRPHGEGHCQPRGRDSAARHDTDGSL